MPFEEQHSAYIVQPDNYTAHWPDTHTQPNMAHTIDLVPMLLSRQRSVLCHDLIRCDRLGPDAAYTRYDVTDEAQIATAVHLLVSHVSNTSVTSSVKEASS
jgi:hypothetical protein